MKTESHEFILQDWLGKLPFQQQALLMTGMRGPDGSNKNNVAKWVVRYLRGVVLKPAGDWDGKNSPDGFMWGDYEHFNSYASCLYNEHDEYPHHFIMHLVHCAEVVGYEHPDKTIAESWLTLYLNFCEAFHMTAETREEMNKRLNDFKE